MSVIRVLLTRSWVQMRFYKRLVGLAVALTASLTPYLMCQASSSAEGLADGSGVWMNMWNYPAGDYDTFCQGLHAKGVRNLFIQTSRSNTPAVANPEKLGPLIDACHKYKIHVIAWSFAELWNPTADADKLIQAAHFSSPTGQHIDAVAADLEKNLAPAKVEAYSKHLRQALGPNYSIIAVVYSPLNLAPQVAQIPWKMLDRYYDVIAPMNYWNSKYKKLDAYEYTKATIQKVRQLVGRPDVEIHIIGDAMGTNSSTITPFFKACQEGQVTSASLYPNFKMTAEQMECIGRYSEFFPVNSRFRLAALREMIRNGTIESPMNLDPSTPMTRGDFYKLLVRHMYAGKPQAVEAGMTAETAANFLDHNGILRAANASPEALSGTMPPPEALRVVASLVDFKSSGKKPQSATAHQPHRPSGHWFSQPAFAEGVSTPNVKPLNYLDAAQIVLQASSGLR
ncbi:MAG: hypothetical protein U0103_22610 [Candidatus Obscuribacterales bacterium]